MDVFLGFLFCSENSYMLFKQIFGSSLKEMLEDLDQGDVAETVRIFFEASKILGPQKKANLSIQDVSTSE